MAETEVERDTPRAVAERIDRAMDRHMQSHANSNSPGNFYCGPACVSEHLRYVVERELKGWTPPEPSA